MKLFGPRHRNNGGSFNGSFLAADGSGNVYAMTRAVNNVPTYRNAPPALRKIDAAGKVSTLLDSSAHGAWAGKAGVGTYWSKLNYFTGIAADRAGKLYLSSTSDVPKAGTANWSAIYKLAASGEMSLFAGSDSNHPGAVKDGTGTDAGFLNPVIQGIDGDGNLYLSDGPYDGTAVLRKVSPAGKASTVAALPAGLNADHAGNNYRYEGNRTIVRSKPDGTQAVVAGTPGCVTQARGALRGCLETAGPMVPLGGGSYAIASGQSIVKLVVPR